MTTDELERRILVSSYAGKATAFELASAFMATKAGAAFNAGNDHLASEFRAISKKFADLGENERIKQRSTDNGTGDV